MRQMVVGLFWVKFNKKPKTVTGIFKTYGNTTVYRVFDLPKFAPKTRVKVRGKSLMS